MSSDSSSSSEEEDFSSLKPFIAPKVKVVGVGSESKLPLVVRVVTLHSLATPKFGGDDEVLMINTKCNQKRLVVSENDSVWEALCSSVSSAVESEDGGAAIVKDGDVITLYVRNDDQVIPSLTPKDPFRASMLGRPTTNNLEPIYDSSDLLDAIKQHGVRFCKTKPAKYGDVGFVLLDIGVKTKKKSSSSSSSSSSSKPSSSKKSKSLKLEDVYPSFVNLHVRQPTVLDGTKFVTPSTSAASPFSIAFGTEMSSIGGGGVPSFICEDATLDTLRTCLISFMLTTKAPPRIGTMSRLYAAKKNGQREMNEIRSTEDLLSTVLAAKRSWLEEQKSTQCDLHVR